MYQGKTVFSQLVDFLPMHRFRQCVSRYHGNKGVRKFSCLDQFLCMAFAQFTFRESLRDIECCLRAMKEKLYHMGFRGKIARSTLADANEKRDCRIYRDFAHVLIGQARALYADEDFGVQLDETVYALDATIIDLCLSLFPWAHFRKTKGAVKLHTLLDLRGNIPSFIAITDGKIHEVNILDVLLPEVGAIYIMDRGYLDFERLFKLHQARAFFIIRAKSNTNTRRLYSTAVDKSTGLRCDQVVAFNGFYAKKEYPEKLRRVVFFDNQQRRRIVFLTNHFSLPALTVSDLYRCRWQVELFFKWIKQHLRIKAFYGTTENAVKTQIWTAISVYVLVAIVRKRLKIELSLYTMLQILSLTLFEKNPVSRVFTEVDYKSQITSSHRQLNLFRIRPYTNDITENIIMGHRTVKVSARPELADIFLRQIPKKTGIWDDCRFFLNTPISKCDWWVVIHNSGLVEPETTLCDPNHIIFVSLEPDDSWLSPHFLKQFSLLLLCDRKILHPNVIYKNALTWWVGIKVRYDGFKHSFSHGYTLDYDTLSAMRYPEKKNSISVICSNKNYWKGHKKRLKFLDKLQSHPISNHIDFFGGGKNPIDDKMDAIAPYKYHLVLENAIIADYWSEKLADSFLGFSYPIYSGCPNIYDYFPKESLRVINIGKFNQTIKVIKDLLNKDLTQKELSTAIKARQMVLNKYNIFNIIADLCNKPAKHIVPCQLKPRTDFDDGKKGTILSFSKLRFKL